MNAVPTRLLDVASGDFVSAELHLKLEFGELLDAESTWTPSRFGMIKKLHAAQVPRRAWPQHWHWNWVSKLLNEGALDICGALSPFRLMGIRAVEAWQGLVLVTSVGHQSKLGKGGKDLLYVKYLEAAPWNLRVELIQQEAQLKGVGRQLMELAVRLSQAMDFRGRLGLHALPQAEEFYRVRCGMTDLGGDVGYQNLRYFELSEEQASAFLKQGRTKK